MNFKFDFVNVGAGEISQSTDKNHLQVIWKATIWTREVLLPQMKTRQQPCATMDVEVHICLIKHKWS